MQKPHDLLFRLQHPLCNEVNEWPIVLVGTFKQADIFLPQHRRNDRQHITILNQGGIHQEPGQASVSINEGMNKNKPLVQLGGKLHRMVTLPLGRSPSKESCHFTSNLIRLAHRVL